MHWLYNILTMRRNNLVYILVLILAIVAPSNAQQLPEQLLDLGNSLGLGAGTNAGLTAFPTLTIPAGGEYVSMASAYTAVARDVGYLDANPAAGSWLRETMLTFSHNNIIADAALENLAFTHRFDDLGIGAALRLLHVPFTQYDQSGAQVDSFRYLETVGILNVSYNLFRSYYFHGLSVGANLKLAYRDIPDTIVANQSAFSVIGDIGLLTGFNVLKPFSSSSPNLTFGATLRNVGIPALGEPLPSEVLFGIGYAPLRQLLLSFDIGIPLVLFVDAPPTPVHFAAGVRSDITDFLSIQAGFGVRNANPRIAMGVTVRLPSLDFHADYTLDATTQFTTVDRFSLQTTLKLGDAGRAARQAIVVGYYLDAAEAFARADYRLAVDLAQQALALNERFNPARELRDLAQQLLDSLDVLEAIRIGEDFFLDDGRGMDN